jgi:hypothetical protein
MTSAGTQRREPVIERTDLILSDDQLEATMCRLASEEGNGSKAGL